MASVYNNCEFCVAAHSVIAKNVIGVEKHVVDAIRNQNTIDDPRLQALAEFTKSVVDKRAWVEESEINGFIAAGFSQEQAIDLIVGVSLKTLSNYVNHLTGTQVNQEFASEIWHKKS